MWNEQPSQRQRHSRTWTDDQVPGHQCLVSTVAPLHYPSQPGGPHDTEIDATPRRVNNAQLDGWTITANAWHFALGQPAGQADGWVGFGGRQGAHWFKFRLARVGYLHGPSRAWQDLGGPPRYDRAQLTRQTQSVTIGPTQDALPIASLATWRDIWTTPGGGALSISWQVTGDGLKETIEINQAAREWIAANRPPTTPASQTWFSFAFQLDWSDVPQVRRAGELLDVAGDFADDGEHITLHNAQDQLLAFLPLDAVTVPSDDLPPASAPLRKRFYHDGTDHLLVVGARCDQLAALPPGPLQFDPTVTDQVASSGDDGTRYRTSSFDTSNAACFVGENSGLYHIFARFTGITASGTIDTAYIQIDGNNGSGASTPLMKVHAVDEADPAAPTSYSEFDADPITTAGVDWDERWTSGSTFQSPDISTVIQELIDTYTLDNNAVIIQIRDDGTAASNYNKCVSYDGAPGSAPALYIEYTEAAAGLPIPVAMAHYRRRQ